MHRYFTYLILILIILNISNINCKISSFIYNRFASFSLPYSLPAPFNQHIIISSQNLALTSIDPIINKIFLLVFATGFEVHPRKYK